MPPVDIEPQAPVTLENGPELLATFMINLLAGGQPQNVVMDRAYDFAYSVASRMVYPGISLPYEHDILLRASELLRDALPFVVADSQRRQQEAEATIAVQKNGPHIHRLN